MIRLAALFCGLLCGAGLFISGLFQPALLQGLLRLAGVRDMTPGLSLLPAFSVAAVILALTRRLSRPLLGGENEPPAGGQTLQAVMGGVLSGLGRGLAGFFPLAAVVALGLFAPGAAISLASVLGGMVLHDLVANRGRFRIEELRSRGQDKGPVQEPHVRSPVASDATGLCTAAAYRLPLDLSDGRYKERP